MIRMGLAPTLAVVARGLSTMRIASVSIRRSRSQHPIKLKRVARGAAGEGPEGSERFREFKMRLDEARG